MSRRIFVFEWFLVAVALVTAIVAYPHLPPQIATHWGTQLQANGFSDRSAIFWFGPGLMSVIILFTRFGPWLSPARYNVASFESTWQHLMLLVFCLFTGLFAVMLWSALGHTFNAGRAMAGILCFFLVSFGNLLSKVRPNFFLGIRTPWTLASESVWIATHRFAAWATVLSGLCGFVFVFAGRPQWVLAPFVLVVLLSTVCSLVLYKRETSTDQQPLAHR